LFRAGHLGRSSVEDGRVDDEWLQPTPVDLGFDLGHGSGDAGRAGDVEDDGDDPVADGCAWAANAGEDPVAVSGLPPVMTAPREAPVVSTAGGTVAVGMVVPFRSGDAVIGLTAARSR
jgi:hypothetical protein